MLEAQGIGVSVEGSALLTDVSLRLTPGQWLSVIGPNGAGKSTLLKTLARFHPPSQGQVHFEGTPIHKMSSQDFAQKVAFVNPREPQAPFPLKVKDYLMLGRYPYQAGLGLSQAEDHRLVEQALQDYDLKHLQERDIRQLSSGEQQRAQLARAVVQTPQYLLLDEPIAHLDIAAQIQALKHLKTLAQKGVGVLMVLHDLNLALGYSDHILLLYQGHAVFQGAPKELLASKALTRAYGPHFKVHHLPDGQAVVLPDMPHVS